jgi:GGDEF domain-containing protein
MTITDSFLATGPRDIRTEMDPGPPRRRRARPVADAPLGVLLARVDDVAKGWLLAILERAPLDEMPAILAAGAARDGPRICDAVLRALADDDDLRRIQPGGSLELLVSGAGELAGARGGEATAAAIDALHDIVWAALRGALIDPDPDQVAELAERLAMVIGLVRGASLREPHEAAVGPASEAALGPAREASVDPVSEASEEPVSRPRVVAVPPLRPPVRRSEAPADKALWMGAFEEELTRAERTGAQLSLLLAELEDADRVTAAEEAGEASATFGRFAQALREAVRRQDILACESESRAWVIARDTGRAGAQALAGRIATAVQGARPWRGAPMQVTVGVAVLGEDGHDSATLVEAAEEARFAAAASGIAVVPAGSPPDDDA